MANLPVPRSAIDYGHVRSPPPCQGLFCVTHPLAPDRDGWGFKMRRRLLACRTSQLPKR
jgi:hypothetical protein